MILSKTLATTGITEIGRNWAVINLNLNDYPV